jgi:hypothetical protein
METRMQKVGAVILTLLAMNAPGLSAQVNDLSPEESQQGWVRLFNGTNLEGWETRSEAQWIVREGYLVTVNPGTANHFVATSQDYENYRIRLEFWADGIANGGVYLGSPATGVAGTGATEVNIFDAHADWPTGSINNVQRYDPPAPTTGRWNTFDITVQGAHVTVLLNGVKSAEGDANRPSHLGRIALQHLAGGEIRYRSIRLLRM